MWVFCSARYPVRDKQYLAVLLGRAQVPSASQRRNVKLGGQLTSTNMNNVIPPETCKIRFRCLLPNRG
jgi:hypothetical protein